MKSVIEWDDEVKTSNVIEWDDEVESQPPLEPTRPVMGEVRSRDQLPPEEPPVADVTLAPPRLGEMPFMQGVENDRALFGEPPRIDSTRLDPQSEEDEKQPGGIWAQAGIGIPKGWNELGQVANKALEAGVRHGIVLPKATPAVKKSYTEQFEGASKVAGDRAKEWEELGRETQGPEFARKFTSGATSLIPSLAAAPAGFPAMVIMAGIQSFGGTYGDAQEKFIKQGDTKEVASQKALTPALVSGAITALVTGAFGKTGVDSLTKAVATGGWRKIGTEILKQAGFEGTEEMVDQVGQSALQMLTYNPELTFEQALTQSFEAGLIGFGLGGGVSGVNQVSAIGKPAQTKTDEPNIEWDVEPPADSNQVLGSDGKPLVLSVDGPLLNPEQAQRLADKWKVQDELEKQQERDNLSGVKESLTPSDSKTNDPQELLFPSDSLNFRGGTPTKFSEVTSVSKIVNDQGVEVYAVSYGDNFVGYSQNAVWEMHPNYNGESKAYAKEFEKLRGTPAETTPVKEPPPVAQAESVSFKELSDDYWNYGAEGTKKDMPSRQEADEVIGRKVTDPEWNELESNFVNGQAEFEKMDLPATPAEPVISEPVAGVTKADVENYDLAGKIKIPDGWRLADYRPTTYGSYYWEVIDPSGNRWKLTVRDHEASPIREQQFGKNDISVYVKDAKNPDHFRTGFDEIQTKLNELSSTWKPVDRAALMDEKVKADEANLSELERKLKSVDEKQSKRIQPSVSDTLYADDLRKRIAAVKEKQAGDETPVKATPEPTPAKVETVKKPRLRSIQGQFDDVVRDYVSQNDIQHNPDAYTEKAKGDKGDLNTARSNERMRLRRIVFQELGIKDFNPKSVDDINAALPLLKEKVEQKERLREATKEAGDESGKIDVPVSDLAVGDALDVDGEQVIVSKVGRGYVELEDGRKFGKQTVNTGEKLYVEGYEPKVAEPEKENLTLDTPESVDQQKTRLAKEAEEAKPKPLTDAEKLAQLKNKRMTGDTGDLGQADMIDPSRNDLFASAKPKPVEPPKSETKPDPIKSKAQSVLDKLGVKDLDDLDVKANAKKLTPAQVRTAKKAFDELSGVKKKVEEKEDGFSQTETKDDAFKRAQEGDEAAFDDLDGQFREIYPDPIDFGRPGKPNPNQVHTPQAFASIFNKAFAARDFDTILDAIKATSDVTIWKPFLQEQFKKQSKDPVAAEKAEWMRHVFNGTRPASAIPRPAPKPATPRPAPPPVTPTPKPNPGTTPPPKPPPTPPGPTPVRIEVDPIPGGKAKSPYQIIEDFSKSIGKAIRVLRMKKNGLGVYHPGSTLTAEKFAGDLDTAAHELAGHWTDDKYGIGKPWVKSKTRSPYDTELAGFWIHGSVTPRSSLRYRRAEGIAEFIRAYVVNPKQAKLDAPKFAAYFEKTLPPEALKSINDFGTDVRTWAGENPLARAGLNIRMEKPTLTERLWKGLKGRGFGFEIDPIDRLRLMFDDPYHYAVKASKMAQELRGGKQLPEKEFELTARLLATHDSRMGDQFENGLVPLRPNQKTTAKGELEVERTLDPLSRQPMTMKWLLDVFDTKNNEAFKQDMRDASAFMVAERTLEKAKQFGRENNVSGIGAGIMSDVKAAKELLAEVAKDPVKEAKLKEAARRYRLWADQNMQMLVDAGRITKGQANEIRKNNQQFVDMHRLSEEFDAANYQQRGGGIGTTKDVVRRMKGSSLEIDNVYSNLLEQTDSIQKEAHRNVVMNNFTDGLRNVRELHGPNLKDFDQFGRKVASADKNTITVYKNGKAEHWQFAPEIHESLKGLGELQTNALFNIFTLPSKFARYMITRGPSFMIRNPLRDTFERSVNSRNKGKPWDIFQGYSKEELSRYEVFGGGQFGNYIVDRHAWNKLLKDKMRELTKDKGNILLSPFKLKRAWEQLGEKSEKVGRIAEFRRAFSEKKKELSADFPSLTPKEIDYNAALYAAGEARGLIDFAKAGTVMKYINQMIPFSNAAMRGLGKNIQGMKENPGRYAMNWGVYVLAPTLAMLAWNRRDEETWKEYQQLPAYRRDLFWNFKVGDQWIMLPKPHLLGVLAGGVERIINGILGDENSTEGLLKSAASSLPLSNLAESTGPLKTFLEVEFNRDTFRNRDIIPSWEKDLKLDLREGTKYASGVGKGIANAINVTGLEADPRQVDHVLNSVGGWGNIATSSSKNLTSKESAMKAIGLFTETPGTSAKDVQWVLDWARENGKYSTKRIKDFSELRKSVFEANDPLLRNYLKNKLRERGIELRKEIESEPKN